MAKSIKLKNNTYLDSRGIVHNKILLSDKLDTYDTKINNLSTNVSNLANDVNKLKVYSTTETLIGTYDGANLYRKLLIGTLNLDGNYQQFSIAGATQIIDVKGFVRASYGQWWSLPSYHAEEGYRISLYAPASSIFALEFGAYFKTGNPYKIAVEYTK